MLRATLAMQWVLIVLCGFTAAGTFFAARDTSWLLDHGISAPANIENVRQLPQRNPTREPVYLANFRWTLPGGEQRARTGVRISKPAFDALQTPAPPREIVYAPDAVDLQPFLAMDRDWMRTLAGFQYTSAAIIAGLGVIIFGLLEALKRKFMRQRSAASP